ncbi:hypothetical protein [Streptomyces sp. NPDC056600]|uniref:hypothetical protein n=1 Tax=Streptomyces sp. NPDC056600 TaxID=3345874 RepID=UPI0036982C96
MPGVGAPHGGRRRMLRVAVPVLVVGALAGSALGWHLVRDDEAAPAAGSARATGAAAEPGSTDGTTAAPEPAATPEESPSPAASGAPDGYRLVEDPAGFALAVPEDWTRDERDSGVFYTPGNDGSLIQVFEVTEAGITPQESLEAASEHLDAQPGYEEISLEGTGRPEGASEAVGTDAAELVYAYDSEELGFRKQVVDCVFTAGDGTMYAVLVAGPADEWPVQQEQLSVALAHFAVD